jgi:NAD(P)H-hydrate epimerase
MLIDADALNLIAKHGLKINSPLVITPHPGEAARLLSDKTTFSSADVQRDRFDAVKKLYDMFAVKDACTVILKGSGTLIFNGETLKVCSLGNAAMAAPGMGDILSGIVIALMAQGIDISEAAELAVCLHASAAGLLAGNKTRGLVASDIIDALPKVLQ